MKYIYYLILIVSISGCMNTELGDEILVISDDPSLREVPSCNFDNDAIISNYPMNPTSWYSPDYRNSFGFQKCTFQPLGYREKFESQYYGTKDFEDLYNQYVFDLSKSEKTMQLFFRSDSEFSYPAYEGKLYMERTNDEWMHFTWCDAKFLDNDGNTITSSGSFSVRF